MAQPKRPATCGECGAMTTTKAAHCRRCGAVFFPWNRIVSVLFERRGKARRLDLSAIKHKAI